MRRIANTIERFTDTIDIRQSLRLPLHLALIGAAMLLSGCGKDPDSAAPQANRPVDAPSTDGNLSSSPQPASGIDPHSTGEHVKNKPVSSAEPLTANTPDQAKLDSPESGITPQRPTVPLSEMAPEELHASGLAALETGDLESADRYARAAIACPC